jgi:hypothetical protein
LPDAYAAQALALARRANSQTSNDECSETGPPKHHGLILRNSASGLAIDVTRVGRIGLRRRRSEPPAGHH